MTPSRLRRLRRRRAMGNLSLVLCSLVMTPVVLVDQKEVILIVDGEQRQVRTFSDDVGELLAASHLRVPEDAVLEPAPSTELEDGTVVLVDLFMPPGEAGSSSEAFEGAAERAEVRRLYVERLRAERLARIRAERERRLAAERKAAEEAARKAAEEAARKAAEEAARKAAEEAARKAAELRAASTIEGCTQDWKTKAGAEALIRCAVERWAVPGGAEKAIAVARCESGLWYLSGKGTAHVGIYQHSVYYWDDRAADYGFAGFDPLNGRANIMVAIQYAHDHGWGAWSGCA